MLFFFLLCKFIYSKTNSKLRSFSQLFHFHILSGLKIVHHVKNSNSAGRWEGTGVGGPSCITFPTTRLPGRGRHSQHWVHVVFFATCVAILALIESRSPYSETRHFFFSSLSLCRGCRYRSVPQPWPSVTWDITMFIAVGYGNVCLFASLSGSVRWSHFTIEDVFSKAFKVFSNSSLAW